jgi:hypothetical protein
MNRSIYLAGLWILATMLLSACANESVSNGGLTVRVGNQWPPIKVVTPARPTKQAKPEIADLNTLTSVPQPRPVVRQTPVVFKPAPVRTKVVKPTVSIPKRNRRPVAPKKRPQVEKCRHIVRDLSMPGSKVVYCMPSKAYQ